MQRLEYAPRQRSEIDTAEMPTAFPYTKPNKDLRQIVKATDNTLTTIDTVLAEEAPYSAQKLVVPTTSRIRPQYDLWTSIIEQPIPAQQDVFTAKKQEEKVEKKVEAKASSEHFYTKEWVQAEVEKVKAKPLKNGETPWWHLSGTGFWVKEQAGQLVRNLKGVGKEAFPDVLELELSKVSQDFEHFEREYLLQLASLTWNLSWQNRDGQQRIICPDYKGGGKDRDGALWSSVTSKEERDGVVYETLFGDEKKGTTGVEGWLRDAPADSFAFIVSPEGWSGFENISYPEAQCYGIHKKADGSLQAYTFRYDATLVQTEALQRKMGLDVKRTFDIRERIKNTMANVALITPEDAALAEREGRKSIRSFGDFVDLMQESVGGRDVAYGEGGGVKTFSEVKRFIEHPELFTNKHHMTDKLNERFKEYARWRVHQGGSWESIEQDLQIAMAFGPLQLNQVYDMAASAPGGPDDWNGSNGDIFDPHGKADMNAEFALIQLIQSTGGLDYNKQKEKLEEKPGCAGGGGSGKVKDSRYASKYVTSMGAPRPGEAKSDDEVETFSCPKCPYKAGKGVAVGDTCPGCGLTKEDFAKESGIEC